MGAAGPPFVLGSPSHLSPPPTMAAKQPNSTIPARRDQSHWWGQRQASGGSKRENRGGEARRWEGSFSSRLGAPLGKTERSLHLLAGWGPCGKGRRVAGHWLPARSLPPPAIPWSWQGNWRNRTEAWRTPNARGRGQRLASCPEGPSGVLLTEVTCRGRAGEGLRADPSPGLQSPAKQQVRPAV